MNNTLEEIKDNGLLMALIIRADHVEHGAEFFTPDELSLQVAAMGYPKGKVITPHIHNVVDRKISTTQEVLIIKKGKVRVDFYRDDKSFLESRVLFANDVILLSKGGHGFEVLEDLQMIEVKQGPYAGKEDKIRFEVK